MEDVMRVLGCGGLCVECDTQEEAHALQSLRAFSSSD
jgi:hypothetical protein